MAARKAVSAKDMSGLKISNMGNGTVAADAATKGQMDTEVTNAKSRANHTGTQLASTVSDFDAAVRLSTLNQMAAPTVDLSINSKKLINVVDPTAAQDAATKAYVDAQLSGVASGQTLKGSVRVAAVANVNIASPGTTIDGITMANGDIALLTAQTTGTQNGPYVFNGAAVAMTRATNWDTDAEAVLGSYWIVRQGTHADKFALLTNDTAITLGTTVPAFTFIGATSGGWSGYTTTCPAVAAGANWVVTHNKGSKLYTWQVYRTASPFDDVDVYGVRTDTNTLTITPDVALASGEFTVVVV